MPLGCPRLERIPHIAPSCSCSCSCSCSTPFPEQEHEHEHRFAEHEAWIQIAGCVLGAVLLAASIAACTTAKHPAVPLVRVHAETDLDCPGKKIHIEPEWGGRYRATGCGRRAIYHTACEQLTCTVGLEEEQAPAWRDRPEPGSLEEGR